MGRIAPAPEHGFSLLEMVVVVAVIAVLSVTATFAVTDRDQGEADLARFVATYDRQRDAAILGGAPRGLALVPGGWHTLVPPPPDARGDGWQPIGRVQKLRGEARFEKDGKTLAPTALSRAPQPDITFLPDGQVSPFTVTFIANDALNRCRSNDLTGLDCEKL